MGVKIWTRFSKIPPRNKKESPTATTRSISIQREKYPEFTLLVLTFNQKPEVQGPAGRSVSAVKPSLYRPENKLVDDQPTTRQLRVTTSTVRASASPWQRKLQPSAGFCRNESVRLRQEKMENTLDQGRSASPDHLTEA